MARTKGCCRRTVPPPPKRRRIVVVSLQVQNPTAIGCMEATVKPAAGAMTRPRRHRIAAAAAALPEEILVWEIFVRLPAKGVLRCRAVCRSWRRLTSAPDFLLAHHWHQPSLPLVTLYGPDSAEGGLPIFKHGRSLLGLDDYQGFKLLASCNGLLLFSLSNGQFSICNPTTRQYASLPCLTAAGHINIAALYLHRPSNEYRVLYWKEAAYYILRMGRGRSPRCIGVPSDIPGIAKVMLDWHETTSLAPPVVFGNCLHWDLGCSNTGILVFNTVAETFRLMRRPAAATGRFTRLCDMEGSVGFSCKDYVWRIIAKIWVLEDYETEVWSLKYHVEVPTERSYNLGGDTRHLVLSHKGDLLVYGHYRGYMFHCDSSGKLLEEFECDSGDLSIIGHRFKESLVNHDISLRQGCASVFRHV